MVIAIDAREMARKNLRSLGLILCSILPYFKEYDIVLLSDVPILQKYIPENAINIVRGNECKGGMDVLKYQKWMRHELEKRKIPFLYQINHFALVSMPKVKQIVVVHDLYLAENIEKISLKTKLIYRISLFATMIHAAHIFTVSEFSKKRLEHFYWKSNKITVNYNGIDLPEKRSIERLKEIDGEYFLTIGRVCYWKGTLEIAKLYDKYFQESDIKLVIAGQAENDAMADALKEIAGRNKNIIWLNYVSNEERESLMQNCRLFLYASRYDGFGLPPLELAIRGKMVLMNDISVLREITQDKGMYIDFYGDAETVVEAIKQALDLNDEKLIDTMQCVAKGYTWRKNAETIKEMIRALE